MKSDIQYSTAFSIRRFSALSIAPLPQRIVSKGRGVCCVDSTFPFRSTFRRIFTMVTCRSLISSVKTSKSTLRRWLANLWMSTSKQQTTSPPASSLQSQESTIWYSSLDGYVTPLRTTRGSRSQSLILLRRRTRSIPRHSFKPAHFLSLEQLSATKRLTSGSRPRWSILRFLRNIGRRLSSFR